MTEYVTLPVSQTRGAQENKKITIKGELQGGHGYEHVELVSDVSSNRVEVGRTARSIGSVSVRAD